MTKQYFILLKHLLDMDSKTNEVNVSRDDCEIFHMTEQEVVRGLFYLAEGEYIRIVRMSPHKDLSTFCTVAIKEKGLDYEENQKRNKKEIAWEIIKFLIPTTISIIALIIAG